MLDALPVSVEVSTRRLGVPLPSFTMLAVTPALAPLIASRMPSSVLLRRIDGDRHRGAARRPA